ncbi:MAG TPA: phosphatidylserine decarboxylase [Lacipirellulaceae bacterium]|nr:phosphatidylserine decarboxylase [Lacipirellulaceae bacterium]
MAALREGSAAGAPHEIIDPRDLKYACNQCTAHWRREHDPFLWRDQLPFVRWGLAELQLGSWPLVGAAAALVALGSWWSWAAVVPLVVLAWWASFFRNPRRTIPADPDAMVAPADGVVDNVTDLGHYEFFGGPAVRIGIFLSIFNVHINRSPRAARVVEMHYKPGEFLDARHPEATIRNEFMWLGFEDLERPGLRFAVRQVSGLLARRIVCILRPGSQMSRGEMFGMIKLGSRTELIVPRDGVRIEVAVGQAVKAGSTIVARLAAPGAELPAAGGH